MLIAITGAKGSGKDTLADLFVAEGFVNLKMAGPLKEMLRRLYELAGYSDKNITLRLEGDLKETPCDLLCGKTPRWAMQSLGTEWRDMIDPLLWTKMWERSAMRLMAEGVPVVCTDIRFHHEAEIVRKLGGTLIRIVRFGPDSGDMHSSETEMNQLSVDGVVENNSTIAALHQAGRKFMKELV